MKRALFIGIDHYEINPLKGCIKDAFQLAEVLSEHHDGSPNYDCHLLVSEPIKKTVESEEGPENEKSKSGEFTDTLVPIPDDKVDESSRGIDIIEDALPFFELENKDKKKKKKKKKGKKSPISESDKKVAPITVAQIQRELAELLSAEADAVLFYFSGHGLVKNLDGYLVTQDTEVHNPGFPISSLIRQINNASHIREITIILDCCYSGFMGSLTDFGKDRSILRKGVAILASSQANEHARMKNNTSIFTKILLEALNGAAADLLGNVAVPDIYGYADKVLGPWEQRPLLICHVSTLNPLRRTKSTLTHKLVRRIGELFEHESSQYHLDHSFLKNGKVKGIQTEKIVSTSDSETKKPEEDGHNCDDDVKEEILSKSQKREVLKALIKLHAAGLIKPSKGKNTTIKETAKKGASCELTSSGKAYWRIVNNDQL